MAHETAVHCADAELAAGLDIRIPADLAADGIDEWLWLVAHDRDEQSDLLRGEGQTLHVHATGEGLGGAGEWLVTRTPAGIGVRAGHAKADVALRGPAALLLLVLLRRLPDSQPGVQVLGDRALLAHWLRHTPF
jgi:predicted lipid carrier protein YhbT